MGHNRCTIPSARRRHRRLACLGRLALGLSLLGLPGESVGAPQGARAVAGGPPVLTGRLMAAGIPGVGALRPSAPSSLVAPA
jgi:hypothetical protein